MNCQCAYDSAELHARVHEAFVNAVPLIGRRPKFWKERTLKEKLLFWTKPEIHDRELMNRILDQVEKHKDFLIDVLPEGLK